MEEDMQQAAVDISIEAMDKYVCLGPLLPFWLVEAHCAFCGTIERGEGHCFAYQEGI